MKHFCPSCGWGWEISDGLVGRKLTCEKCGAASFGGFQREKPRASARGAPAELPPELEVRPEPPPVPASVTSSPESPASVAPGQVASNWEVRATSAAFPTPVPVRPELAAAAPSGSWGNPATEGAAKGWLYSAAVFLGVTFVTMPQVYIGAFQEPAQLVVIPGLIVCGAIVGAFSAYIKTPFVMWRLKSREPVPGTITGFLSELASRAGMRRPPRVAVIETPEVNAMCYQSLLGNNICLTRGLLDAHAKGLLEDDEVKAVLGHEVGHLLVFDSLRFSLVLSWITIADLIGSIFILFGQGFSHAATAVEDSSGYVIERQSSDRYVATKGGQEVGCILKWFALCLYVTGLLQKLLAKVASLLALHLSRVQEYAADRAGARLVTPDAMGRALRRIHELDDELAGKPCAQLPDADRWQTQPMRRSWVDRLWNTHPALEKRLQSLRLLPPC